MTHELNLRNPSGCSLLSGPLNRRICGSYRAQICSCKQTSHIPGTLSEMPAVALMEDDKDVEFG